MTRTIHGVVHGKTITVEEDLGMAEGQEVELTMRTVGPPSPSGRQPGEGFLRTEGTLTNDTEWDGIMEEIYQSRKQERRPPFPDLGEP
jgi:hypothetical protein